MRHFAVIAGVAMLYSGCSTITPPPTQAQMQRRLASGECFVYFHRALLPGRPTVVGCGDHYPRRDLSIPGDMYVLYRDGRVDHWAVAVKAFDTICPSRRCEIPE